MLECRIRISVFIYDVSDHDGIYALLNRSEYRRNDTLSVHPGYRADASVEAGIFFDNHRMVLDDRKSVYRVYGCHYIRLDESIVAYPY